jgi:hypothetical protein
MVRSGRAIGGRARVQQAIARSRLEAVLVESSSERISVAR